MSNRRKRFESGEEEANWMTTYSDMVTLLLTFFVMLFSMSAIDNQKYEELKHSLASSFLKISGGDRYNVRPGSEIYNHLNPDGAIVDENKESFDEAGQEDENEILEDAREVLEKKAEDVRESMEEILERLGLEEQVQVVREGHTVLFRINSVLLFDLGKADVKESGKEVLMKFSEVLKEVGKDVIIQGHTCDLPINTPEFPSNWELSTKRATNVAKYLIDNCDVDPAKITATGNGEFRPVAPNDSEENRQLNRRIDIIVADDYFSNIGGNLDN